MLKALFVFLVIVGSAAAARADARAAEKHFDDGETAYRKGRFLDAAKHFEAAYAELPAAEIAFSAAQAYRLGYQGDPAPAHVKRAIELYELYLRDVGEGGPRTADASAHLFTLKKEWRDLVTAGKATDDRISSDKTQIGIVVPAKVKGATVLVDGKDVSGLDYVDVEPGDRLVRVEAPGYAPYEEKVPVARGGQILVRAELEPKPALVKLKTESGVQVSVDGRAVRLRGGVFEAPAGKRFITVSRRGRRPYAKELELAPGATVEVEAELRSTDQRRIAKFVLIGSGVLLGATALTTTFALIADSRASGRKDDGIGGPDDGSYYNTWRSRRNTARSASFILGGAAVFAAAAAIGLYVFDNPSAESAPVLDRGKVEDTRFTPMVFGDGLGIGIEGGW